MEKAKNNTYSVLLRLTHIFPQTVSDVSSPFRAIAINPAISEPSIPVFIEQEAKTSTTRLEAALRSYLKNGYDDGFSVYGGCNRALIFRSGKYNAHFTDFDKNAYTFDAYHVLRKNGNFSLLRLSIGVHLGLKYTFEKVGTFYIDANPMLNLFYVGIGNPNVLIESKAVTCPIAIGFRVEISKKS